MAKLLPDASGATTMTTILQYYQRMNSELGGAGEIAWTIVEFFTEKITALLNERNEHFPSLLTSAREKNAVPENVESALRFIFELSELEDSVNIPRSLRQKIDACEFLTNKRLTADDDKMRDIGRNLANVMIDEQDRLAPQSKNVQPWRTRPVPRIKGDDMFDALERAAALVAQGDELRISVVDSYDLKKLDENVLRGRGVTETIAKKIADDMTRGDLSELSNLLGVKLIVDRNKKESIIPNAGIIRSAGAWATDPNLPLNPNQIVDEIRRMRQGTPL